MHRPHEEDCLTKAAYGTTFKVLDRTNLELQKVKLAMKILGPLVVCRPGVSRCERA